MIFNYFLVLLVLLFTVSPLAAHTVEQDNDGFPWERLTLQLGAATVMHNVIDDFPLGRFNRATGPSRTEIYLFQASYTLRDLNWEIGDHSFSPQLELPVVIGIANERNRKPFADFNAGLTVRWKDFPWNHAVYTNLESGAGLSYTQRVYSIEHQRHPERARSHMKFYLPIQITFAHPRHRQHQTVLFLHHHSGGRIFDQGGTNALGIGYRYVFRER